MPVRGEIQGEAPAEIQRQWHRSFLTHHFSESFWKYFWMRPRYAGGRRVGSIFVTSGLSSFFARRSEVSTEKWRNSSISFLRLPTSSSSALSSFSTFIASWVARSLLPYKLRKPV